jgi:cell division protein FtsQ
MTTTGVRGPAEPETADPGQHPAGPARRRILFVAAAALLAVVLVVWLVAFSTVFGVRTVAVRGTHLLTAADVRAAAAVGKGTPLVRLDTGVIARRVEALPVVRSASVQTHFPSTVTITVTERIAVGYLDLGSRFALVDRDGVQYRTQGAKPAHLPLFAVPPGSAAISAARAVAGVAAALGPQLLGRVSSIQAFDQTAITVLLTDGRVVRWGSVDRSADKARVLPALLAQPGTQFDVTNPDQVYAR